MNLQHIRDRSKIFKREIKILKNKAPFSKKKGMLSVEVCRDHKIALTILKTIQAANKTVKNLKLKVIFLSKKMIKNRIHF